MKTKRHFFLHAVFNEGSAVHSDCDAFAKWDCYVRFRKDSMYKARGGFAYKICIKAMCQHVSLWIS